MTLVKDSEILFTNSYRKLFDDYLVFHESIRLKYQPLPDCPGFFCFGIDPYSLPEFLKVLKKQKNHASICCFFFLDAVIDATLHYLKLENLKKIILPKNVFILNSCNIFELDGHLSHTYPQIILGLKKSWSDEELIIFNQIIYYYMSDLVENLEQERKAYNIEVILETLANDKDLNSDYKGPRYLGNISKPRGVYQNAFKEILASQKKTVPA